MISKFAEKKEYNNKEELSIVKGNKTIAFRDLDKMDFIVENTPDRKVRLTVGNNLNLSIKAGDSLQLAPVNSISFEIQRDQYEVFKAMPKTSQVLNTDLVVAHGKGIVFTEYHGITMEIKINKKA